MCFSFLIILLPLILPSATSAPPSNGALPQDFRLTTREYVTADTVSEAYDFVIVGGGLAGLAIASFLSSDSSRTVLVIEAGDTSDSAPQHSVPALAYYQSLLGTSYDWKYYTVPQPSAGGNSLSWPRGKLLGGSSAVNGMYLVRPHEVEVNAWHDMVSSQSEADSWNWDSLFTAMKRSETFTPPSNAVFEVAGMRWSTSSHGTTGPVHATYPGYMVPVSKHWLPTLASAGISINDDAYGGRTVGGFFALSSINPSNWTRSDSKSAFIDPLPPRPNLHILVNSTVTRIVFDSSTSADGIKAESVEYSTGRDSPKRSVRVSKEVILSGGTVGSPQILQLSGVGPRDILTAVGIDVKVDLPGVGAHLQDHLSAGVYWRTAEETQGTIMQSGSDLSKSAEFLSFVNSGICYVNSTTLFGAEGAGTMHETISNELNKSAESIAPVSAGEALEGYKAIYRIISDTIFPSEVGLVELLFSINAPGQIAVQAALQHPLSQGRIYINSSSVFDPPVIDPRYFTHWADVVTMREGLKLARRIGNTTPLSSILGLETQPGPEVVTDDQWDDWLRRSSQTEYHPSSTCAMLPKSQGGVVDNKLRVYGTSNVRVIDASIFPISFAAHFMAPLYGVVEKAGEIILSDYQVATAQNVSNATPFLSNSEEDNGSLSSIDCASTMWLLILTGLLLKLLF